MASARMTTSRPTRRRTAAIFRFPWAALRVEPLERRELLAAAGLLPAEPPGALGAANELNRLASSAIEGTAWIDVDASGTRGAHERGLGGAVVFSDLNYNGRLDDQEPRAAALFDNPQTSFDEAGLYRLGELAPGWHMVRLLPPTASQQTFPALPPGHLPPPWGDASAHVVFAGAGALASGVDFGVQPQDPGSAGGRKWLDRNGDGRRQDDEPGLAGVTIYSDRNFNGQWDDGESSTVTQQDDPATDFDEAGLYRLTDLPAGFHALREVVPADFEQTFPRWYAPMPLAKNAPGPDVALPISPPAWFGPGAHEVTLEAGAFLDGLDFGNRKIEPGSVSGVKWLDSDGDGVRDEGEPGLAGVTIYVDLNFNAVRDAGEPHVVSAVDDPATPADETGSYRIGGLRPGAYAIREALPPGFQQTFPLAWPEFSAPPNPPDAGVPLPPAWPWPDGAHHAFVDVGAHLQGLDFGNRRREPGVLAGRKWLDANGDGVRGQDEPGLAGVVIYLDSNDNGKLDADEPAQKTAVDDSATAVDETGEYRFEGLLPGSYVVREVVPAGYRQTFPLPFAPRPWLPPAVDGFAAPPTAGVSGASAALSPADPFAVVSPESIEVSLAAGAAYATAIKVAVFPNLLLPLQLEVRASDLSVGLVNLSGPQTNGGGGAASEFQVAFHGGGVQEFQIEIVDRVAGGVIAAVPVRVNASGPRPGGAHRVVLGPGEKRANLHFGNQLAGKAAAAGRTWIDRDGNGRREDAEPGLPGATVYADLNFNGVLDADEPRTQSRADDPTTDFDETGLYVLEGLAAGRHWIAEVVPAGYQITSPSRPVIAIFPPPPGGHVHEVDLPPNSSIDGLDFGNLPVKSGVVEGLVWHDADGNGKRDRGEAGLPGATVYADLNFNGRWDFGEPNAKSLAESATKPLSDVGRFRLEVAAGWHAIRVAPLPGFRPSYPRPDEPSLGPFPPAHHVDVAADVVATGVDFGLKQVAPLPPRPVDHDGDGAVGDVDRQLWERAFGEALAASTGEAAARLDGLSLLAWQRAFGQLAPAVEAPALSLLADNPNRGAAGPPRGAWIGGLTLGAAAEPAAAIGGVAPREFGAAATAADAALVSLAAAFPPSPRLAPAAPPQRGRTAVRSGWRDGVPAAGPQAEVAIQESLRQAW